jgi:hypothetical protein
MTISLYALKVLMAQVVCFGGTQDVRANSISSTSSHLQVKVRLSHQQQAKRMASFIFFMMFCSLANLCVIESPDYDVMKPSSSSKNHLWCSNKIMFGVDVTAPQACGSSSSRTSRRLVQVQMSCLVKS